MRRKMRKQWRRMVHGCKDKRNKFANNTEFINGKMFDSGDSSSTSSDQSFDECLSTRESSVRHRSIESQGGVPIGGMLQSDAQYQKLQ